MTSFLALSAAFIIACYFFSFTGDFFDNYFDEVEIFSYSCLRLCYICSLAYLCGSKSTDLSKTLLAGERELFLVGLKEQELF